MIESAKENKAPPKPNKKADTIEISRTKTKAIGKLTPTIIVSIREKRIVRLT